MEFSRHETTGPRGAEFADGLTDSTLKQVAYFSDDPRAMNGAINTAQLAVGARLSEDPRAARIETWEAVVLGMQISSAIFATAIAPVGSTVECRINHEIHAIPATGPSPQASAGNWLTAFWFAVVCRDQKRMTELAEVPIDLLRASGAEYDEYIYDWVDSLQCYWLERPDLIEKLTTTFEKSDPARARITPRDLLDHILFPPINLFYKFFRRDESGYNEALLESLVLWKQYWTDEDYAHKVSGLFPLAVIAVTCLAVDIGFAIEVDSDYLPKHLLQRGWLGEFPT